MKYNLVCVEFIEFRVFDYIFILMNFFYIDRRVIRFFRFYNILIEYVDFIFIISRIWVEYINGIVMFRLWRKLKLCKDFLKSFMKKDVGNVNVKFENVREVLKEV